MAMDDRTKADNLRELVGLLDDTYVKEAEKLGLGHGRPGISKQQVCEMFEAQGLLKVYDTALPQDWLNQLAHRAEKAEVLGKSEVELDSYYTILTGTVWCYDVAQSMGRAFPLNQRAARIFDHFNIDY